MIDVAQLTIGLSKKNQKKNRCVSVHRDNKVYLVQTRPTDNKDVDVCVQILPVDLPLTVGACHLPRSNVYILEWLHTV